MPAFLIAAIACAVASLPAASNLPLVDPGLFVLTGVKTCGDTLGYCLLGSDCTTDDDFLPDPSGNCDGLKAAFTPSAPFACCKSNRIAPSPLPPPQQQQQQQHQQQQQQQLAKRADVREPSESEWPRTSKERVDLRTDGEQLEKLDEIGFVVKKIVEQLINETANTIRDRDPNPAENLQSAVAAAAAPPTEANAAVRNDAVQSSGATAAVEIAETVTVNPPATEPPATDDDALRTYPPPETEDSSNQPQAGAGDRPPSDAIESIEIDDQFRAEKNVCRKTCNSEIVFAVDKKPLCYGTLLDEIWILTSATCASRLNKADIRKISASRKDWFGPTMSISNLLVHENFKSPTAKNSPDNNDLALASLNQPLVDQQCIPCFAQKRNLTNEVCRSFQNTNFKNSIKSTDNCEGQVQLRKLVVNSYLVLPCNRWRMQYNQDGRLGSGLWCDGKLAGVQTGVGVGSLIYTPVNEYGEWISDNKRIERRK